MDIPLTTRRSPRTAKVKAAKALKKIPTALLLRKKAECDATALKIVERMMEPKVDVGWLLQSLSKINKSHMEDTAEERSIVKLCGYVLCDNPLTKVVTKQYQISTLRNKVYDVIAVKNYCSYSCYRAAEYLMEQMPTSPLWHRDQEETPTFRILPDQSKNTRSAGPPGVEVDLTGVQLPEVTDNTEEKFDTANEENESAKRHENCASRYKRELEDSKGTKLEIDTEMREESSPLDVDSMILSNQEEETNFLGTCDKNQVPFQKHADFKVATMTCLKEGKENFLKGRNENSFPVSRDITELSKSSAVTADAIVSIPVSKLSESRKTEQRKPKESKTRSIPFDTLTSRVEKSLKEWITDKTLCLLHGEVAEKQKILEIVTSEEKYAVLCKKLNHLQLEEEREANERIVELKPTPDFSVLQEKAKGMELKVRAFWEGKMVIDGEAGKNENTAKQEEEQVEAILPLLDLHAPNVLRRRIFLDKLNRVLPDLLQALTGSGQISDAQYSYTSERCSTVKALVSTFSLSATNIIFKTAEWTLVALIIIKLLGIIDPRIKYLLGSKQATMYISMILMSYKLESHYLESLVTSLTGPPNTTEIEETKPIDS